MTTRKRWKVVRIFGSTAQTWSLGYPSKRSAQAAARRLDKANVSTFAAAPMEPEDYRTMEQLEKLEGRL